MLVYQKSYQYILIHQNQCPSLYFQDLIAQKTQQGIQVCEKQQILLSIGIYMHVIAEARKG